ncbi:hypothetical protein Tco_0307119 [Tanacetum coccineum]
MTNGESVKDMTSKFDKLEKFEGQDFRRWQKKMHFLLTTLKVVYVLSTPSPVWSENETLEATRKRMKMLRALRSFFFRIFCLAVTTPSIVVVDVPSSFAVVRATGLKELPSSMIS